MSGLDSWARSSGLAVLIVGHPPKSGAAVGGSTDWEAAARSVWTLSKEPRERNKTSGPTFWKLTVVKHNYGQTPSALELDFETGLDDAARWRAVGPWGADNERL